MTENSFDKSAIAAEYERLGYERGWSFMATPEETMRTAKVAIVGLNPGAAATLTQSQDRISTPK